MLNSLELAAAFREAQAKKGVTNAEVAKHFGIKSPSVSEWRKYGRIGKDKIEALVRYFLDVVPPEHWGLSLSAPEEKPPLKGLRREPAASYKSLSPEALQLVELIRDADISRSVSSDSWQQLAGILRAMMGNTRPAVDNTKNLRPPK